MKNEDLTMAVIHKIDSNIDSMLASLEELPPTGAYVSAKVTSADETGNKVETSINGTTSSLISMLSSVYTSMTKEEDSADDKFKEIVRLVLDTLLFTANSMEESEKAFTLIASLHATYIMWRAAMTETSPQVLKDLAKESACVLTPADLGLGNNFVEDLEKEFNEAFYAGGTTDENKNTR